LPPQLEPATKLPFTDQSRVRIDDVEKELFVLISQASDEDQRKAKHVWTPESATKDLKSILGCLDCKCHFSRSRSFLGHAETGRRPEKPTFSDSRPDAEHPRASVSLRIENVGDRVSVLRRCLCRFYAGLGAVEDFHDDLLIISYEQQIASDDLNTSYYLECLQGIAEGRNSEQLQFKVAIEATSDKISRRDVRAAYRELGLDAKETHEDDTIIGIFNSRITDAPKHEPEMRRALKVIGQDRSSGRIQIVASQGDMELH